MARSDLSYLNGGPKQYPSSIWDALEPSFVAHKHRLAVVATHQAANHLEKLVGKPGDRAEEDILDCLAWSYQQFMLGALRIASGFKHAGIEHESVLMTALPNSGDFFLFYLATFLQKLNLAPIDFGTLLEPRKEQLQHFFQLLSPKIMVIADTAGAKAVDAAEKATGHKIQVKITLNWDQQGPLSAEWTAIESFAQADSLPDEEAILHEARGDNFARTAFTIFTSGTSSGHPKGCPRPVLSLIHNDDTVQRSWTEKPARRMVDTANFRIIVLTISVSTWNEGGALLLSGPSTIPKNIITAIDKYKVTDAIIIVALLRMLDTLPEFSSSKMTSMRTIPLGGDVVTRSAIQLCEQMFPNCQAYSGHAMSEGGNFVGWDFTEPVKYFGEIATIGTIRPGAVLKVVDLDGKIVPRGQPGELHLDGKTMVQHYLQDVNPDTFYSDDHGRWFRTGDIAMIDETDHIYILGRSKDIIKRAGVPITPAALESCLQPYAGSEVAVLGVPHPILGSVPYAVLTTFGGKTEDDLKHHVVDLFGKDYALGRALTLEQLGLHTWPINASGKIQRLDVLNALQTHPELLPEEESRQ